MKIFGRELKFRKPPEVDVVIFDECNSHLVKRVINDSYSLCVFNQRPEDLWVNVRVLVKIFCNMGYFDVSSILKHQRGIFIGALKNFRYIYFKSCLDVMNPKAVVTYIDNSSSFGWLSKYSKDYPLIAIQNGSRLSYAANKDSSYYVQHFFSYGEHEKSLFPKLGYHVDNFYPAGSLVASLYFDPQLEPEKEIYDLLIVSTWRGNIGFQQDVKDTMHSMKIMDQLLAQYVKTRGIKAAVILRAERDSEHWIMPEVGKSEEDYYRDIYGDSIDIIETDFSKRNIFPVMQKSKVIISCLSSALLEAFGIGKKILFCNFTGTNLYHSDFDEELVSEQSNWPEFSTLLDDLFAQQLESYQSLNMEKMKYYMSFPSGISTHDFISNKIDEIINESDIHVKKVELI